MAVFLARNAALSVAVDATHPTEPVAPTHETAISTSRDRTRAFSLPVIGVGLPKSGSTRCRASYPIAVVGAARAAT